MTDNDGVLRGLASIRGRREQIEREKKERDESKAVWFKLPKDGDSALIRPLQELDTEASGYNPDRGIGFVALEHANPGKGQYMRKALCSMDWEGMCVGCETHALDFKAGWGIRERLYLNVLAKFGREEPFVAVLSQGTSGRSITPTLLEYAEDPENPSITNRWFKIVRTGSGLSDTSYSLIGKDRDDKTFDEYELFNLDNIVRKVPYADQKAHYGLLAKAADADESEESSSTSDDVW
jgi:hypothetical protein